MNTTIDFQHINNNGANDDALFTTMVSNDAPKAIRVACAKRLLSSKNGQYRSQSYWWLKNGCPNFVFHPVLNRYIYEHRYQKVGY